MEALIQWLDDNKGKEIGDTAFADGFAFFKEHSRSKRLLRLFSTGNNRIKSRKLYNELLCIAKKLETEAEKQKAEEESGGETPEEKEPEESFKPTDTIGLPEELKTLHVKKGRLFKQAAKARRQLYEMHFGEEKLDPEESFSLVQTAVENMFENKMIWEEIGHFKQKGEMLNQHPELAENRLIAELKAMNPLELQKRYQNLPSYISKARKFIRDNPGSDKIKEKQEKIAGFERKINLIETILSS